MIGRTLLHYEITAKLGEGGMGAVYRARDTKLGREVAIKVLPEAFTEDAERLARFEREARVLAALDHPNIAGIYEVGSGEIRGDGESGDEPSRQVYYLAMQLAEGEDLASRLERGPMAVEEALGVARQIADALESAHERGIVHRDLKPANIKLGPDGIVKVLDFGLAKAWDDGPGSSPDLTQSPTLTAHMTEAGIILGTAGYMSPEQARGHRADRRSDIWSFGVVLWEMLTGTRLFAADTVSDTLARVLMAEPDWAELDAPVPTAINRLLRRCLERDPKLRLQAIGEARIRIDRYLADPAAEDDAPGLEATDRPPGWIRLLPWAVAGALVIALGAALLTRPAGPTAPTRAMIPPPEGTSFDLDWLNPGLVAVSPDGRSLAFSATDADGNESLYVRHLEEGEARPLPGTAVVGYPFWSPDGRFIAFFGGPGLQKIDPTGGPPITLAPASNGKGGTWNRKGDIVFAPAYNSALYRVSAAGGEAEQITEVDRELSDGHRFPQFLPDGERFLYLARTNSTEPEASQLMVGSLAGDDPVELFRTSAGAHYALGHLFFLLEDTLMARPFDPESLELTGEMFPVAENVTHFGATGAFSISEGGTLVFHTGELERRGTLQWVDRDGATGGTLGSPANFAGIRVSPDGQRAVITVGQVGSSDLWLVDLESGLRNRFTFHDIRDWFAAWSADGERIAFSSWRTGAAQIYVKPTLTADDARPLFENEQEKHLRDWSPDERYLVYEENLDRKNMYAVDLVEGGDPIPLQPSRFSESFPRVSPDGRWLAYASNAPGRYEIHVTAFPAGGRKWQVSSEGGGWPVWDPSGRWLYWLSGQALMSAAVDGSGTVFRIGAVSKIADGLQVSSLTSYPYDITPDGRRFLFDIQGTASPSPLTLVLDLPAELRGKRR